VIDQGRLSQVDDFASRCTSSPPCSASFPVAIEGFLGMDFIGRFTMTVDRVQP
jgi:hypothetical protein